MGPVCIRFILLGVGNCRDHDILSMKIETVDRMESPRVKVVGILSLLSLLLVKNPYNTTKLFYHIPFPNLFSFGGDLRPTSVIVAFVTWGPSESQSFT